MRGATSKAVVSCLAVAILAGVVLEASSASAAEEKRKVHVIQQRPFLHRLRLELTPQYGYTINDTLSTHHQAGGTLRFHIDEEWSLGGTYAKYFGWTNANFDQVEKDFQVFPEFGGLIDWFAGGELSYIPIYGKFVLFGAWVVHWDFYLLAGGGATKLIHGGVRGTGTVGAGTRIYLTKWLTLDVSLKDHIYSVPFKAGDEIWNNVVFNVGFGFFMPFNPDYKFPK